MQRRKVSLVIVLLWGLHFVKISCVKRNLYFPNYYYPFDTSNSQIIGVFSSHCKHLKDFVINTPFVMSNNINHTQSIVDSCIQVINPLYAAVTNNTLNYDVYQHLVYYTLVPSESQLHDYGNLTFNLVDDEVSLVYHLFLYNVFHYTASMGSLKFWVNKLANSTAFFNYNYNVNNSQMVNVANASRDDKNNDNYNYSEDQVLISNCIIFHIDDNEDTYLTNAFMYDQCGASIRLKIESMEHNQLVKENQTVLISYSSDVMGLSNQDTVKCCLHSCILYSARNI